MARRTCWECRYLRYEAGMPDYSDQTPGWDAQLGCLKFHWELDPRNEDTASLRGKIFKAEDCVDFEPFISREPYS